MHHFRSPTLAALLVPIFAIASSPILSAADGDTPPNVDAHLKTLDQEIQDLKRQLAATKVTTAPTPAPLGVQAPLAVVRANSQDGFVIESADGSNKLRVGGYVDFDYRYFADDERLLNTYPTSGAADSFLIRHARPDISATVGDIFDFRFLAEFAPTQSPYTNNYVQGPILLDAYVAARIDPAFVITAGQFKSPVGLEYLQYTPYDSFVELGLASMLIPGRDEGMQLSGKLLAGILFYQVGVFNGGIDGAANVYSDDISGKEGEARILVAPFITSGIDWLADFNVGVSGTYGKEVGSNLGLTAAAPGGFPGVVNTTSALPTFKTTGQLTFFQYNANEYANGEHIRYSPQLYWAAGPFSTLDEYVVSRQRIGGIGTNVPNTAPYVTNKAYQVSAGWVLTGEKASYNGIIPAADVNKGGWGAWELVARINHLEIGDQAFQTNNGTASTGANTPANITKSSREATALGVGLNWLLNRNVEIVLDVEHTEFKGGGGGTVLAPKDRLDENLVVSRLQLVF
jgi:phosphate-selective porin OprO and OprP